MTYIHTNYNDPSFVPVSPWVRVTHSGEFGQDLELLSARQALTLQGAQQVVAILRTRPVGDDMISRDAQGSMVLPKIEVIS